MSEIYWTCAEGDLLERLESRPEGLASGEVAQRRDMAARNIIARTHGTSRLLLRQFRSPIILLLVVAALLSTALGETTDAAIILAIILGSGLLTFHQERTAIDAVEALLATVRVHVEVRRDGRVQPVPLDDVVPGDVVHLRAGDIVPGDCRVLTANSLQIDESALTGESEPGQKQPGLLPAETPLARRGNCLFFGTHAVSGEGTAVVVATGKETEFGQVSSHVAQQHVPTSFERGIRAFGYLLVRATAVLVIGIFVVNIALDRPFFESMLFSLALAVGLTPQLLPAIVTVSLSHGARLMAARNVIVKRLDAIEDVGAIDMLCTDKTGTLTEGHLVLNAALDATGQPSERVRDYAAWNAALQSGFRNPMDEAILETRTNGSTPPGPALGEVPFDFQRRRLSVLVATRDGPLLVTKGALEPLLAICRSVASDDGDHPIEEQLDQILKQYEILSAQGFRVLGVACKPMASARPPVAADESELVFSGFLTFADPPKPGVAEAVGLLRERGIRTCMITGDNPLAAAHVARAIGLVAEPVLTGDQVSALSDAELARAVGNVSVFAVIDPIQKERIVRALSRAGHTVGFLGDGINDAPALHTADVGISVNGAVDVAKHTADLVLLEKDLNVLAAGIDEGRRVFTNTMKYVYVTTSANFGNMLSMAGAAIFLPFLPLLPRQILLLNFLSDIPGASIAADRVDAEQVARPRNWDITAVRNFMIIFGAISSGFDYLTFAVLRLGFHADATEFRSAWFVASVATELAAMLILRTPGMFLLSRPGRGLLWSSAVVGVLTIMLPFSPLASALGLRALDALVMLTLAGIIAGYVIATEIAKRLRPSLLS